MISFQFWNDVLFVVVWLIRLGGPHFYVYVWFFLMIVSVIMMMIYPTMIAPLFNQYIKLEEGPLYEAIEKLAKRVSFPLTEVLLCLHILLTTQS